MHKLLSFHRESGPEVSQSLQQHTTNLRAKPTLGYAFKAWLASSETSLTPVEYQSAKNFARAYQIWLGKAVSIKDLDKEPIHATSLVHYIKDFAEEFSLSEDPISERLSPSSKTAHVGANTRRFIVFLDEQGVFSREETLELLRQCTLMDNGLRRCQRIKWLMTQQDIYFQPRLGGRQRRTTLEGRVIKGSIFEVADLGENFILVHTCGQGGELLISPDDPLKIHVPRPAISLLERGDELQIDLQKAAGADYWVPTGFTGISSGSTKFATNQPKWPSSQPPPVASPSESATVQTLDAEINKFLALSKPQAKPPKAKARAKSPARSSSSKAPDVQSAHEVALARICADKAYQQRRDEQLLAGTVPDDGFPESTYTEEWYGAREHDLASDEEVGAMWDGGEDDGDDDSGDDDDDGDGDGGD